MGEEQVLGVTKLVNWLLAKPALAIFGLLHLQPANPQYPIPNFFAMELVVFLFAIVFFFVAAGADVGGTSWRDATMLGILPNESDGRGREGFAATISWGMGRTDTSR